MQSANRYLRAGRGRCFHYLTAKVFCAAAAATASPPRLLFFKGQNRFLPAGRGRSCHRLTAKVFFF
jgi:hypothetical protein